MGRSIHDFTGNNVVIGCSATHEGCTHECHASEDSYYSINIARDVNPDLLFDITGILPAELHNRFQVTLVENLDAFAYNNPPVSYPRSWINKNGKKGFENIWNMTHGDGFIFINGCPRQQEYRNSIQGLKYVEISRDDHDDDDECVIIPKNQTLSIEELNEKIRSNSEISLLINKLNKITYIPVEHQFVLFDIPYDTLPTIRTSLFLVNKLTEIKSTLIEKHKKIPEVRALYKTIELLFQLADTNPTLGELGHNKTHFFANALCDNANSFFKYDTAIVNRDILLFKNKFSLLIEQNQPPLIQNTTDYLLLLANILIAFTVVGTIPIGAKMIHSKMTTGRYLPLFFEASPEQHISYQAKIAVDNLVSSNEYPFQIE